jgi:hypothetical protein
MGNDSRKSPAKVVPLGSKRQEREVVVNPDTGEVIDFSLSDKDKGSWHAFLEMNARRLIDMLAQADHPEHLARALSITIRSMAVPAMRKRAKV